ncbi:MULTISPECIES: autoinducer-binding transcriptional regulator TraR [Agrobacterium]|uniref:autoinducer-binding transcriptional regulator TraR n=1 Tax=Agrobacterium tumefaciens TaxID=358 RepID=UPI000EF1C8B1|nr:hypothetical protein At1D1108_51880 [Agrobacterium tumefaciens]NSY09761.1 transcriptional regulator TraR [Agrobacterium tumefaciens]NSY93382.1 transcriptional regulator TraR [Agrobacterium tumefaciens]
MAQWVERLLDINAIARDQTTLKSALAELADRFDFSGYAFVNLRPGQAYGVSSYHPEWQTRYRDNGFQLFDPVMTQARRLMRAFSWSGSAERGSLSAKEKAFFSDASDYDIRSGVSIPIATPNGAISMLTFASSKPKLILERDIDAIAAASAVGQLHAHIEHLRIKPTIEEQVYLTPKEATYVRWIELGKTVDETADLEQVKYSTVRITLDGVKERYNLTNNTQLVGLAVRRGLI